MAIQIIEEKPGLASRFGAGIAKGMSENRPGKAFSEAMQERKEKKQIAEQMAAENQELQKLFGDQINVSDIQDPQIRKQMVGEMLKAENKRKLFEDKLQRIKEEYGHPKEQHPEAPSEDISDDQIMALDLVDPTLARIAQSQKKERRREFEGERAFHTGFSKEMEKEVEAIRTSLPKKEMALDFSRNAIESGNTKYFSLDKLADATGIDLFRTAKGAQLITAGKENLLSNLSRVTGRAQNMWFEQRLNSMFPKIGQSDEANLSVQEMLEGEVALDNAYLTEFDRLAEEDEREHGFVRKDIAKRARASVKDKEKQITNRTSYRLKKIEEKEKGIEKLKQEVGKNVPRGTPMTDVMMKLYADKFGVENALAVAKKNGYYIPSKEEAKIFATRPQEFREIQ